MPNSNIAHMKKQAVAKKEAKRVKNITASLLGVASRSQTSPIDLSEPRANKHFVDFPPPSPPPPISLRRQPEKQVAA
jgi:hypothetical protein